MKKKLLYLLMLFQNLILFLMPYVFSKRGNHSRNITIIVFVIVTIIYLIINRKEIKLDKKIIISGIVYILCMSVSMLFSNEYVDEKFKVYQRGLFAILFGFCITQVDIKEKLFKYSISIFALFSFFPVLRGILEWRKSNFSINMRLFGDNWPTVFSVELGIFLVTLIVVLFYEKNIILKIVCSIILLFGFFVVIGTQTRIIILIIPLMFIIVSLLRNFKVGLVLNIFLALLFSIFMFMNYDIYFKRFQVENKDGGYSNKIRIETYKRSLEMIKKSHLLGVGFYNFQSNSLKLTPEYKQYVVYDKYSANVNQSLPLNSDTMKIYGGVNTHSHSNYLEILLTQGILGLISYLLLIYYIMKNLVLNYKNKELEKYKIIFLLGIMILFYVALNGLVESNIYMEKVNQMTFFVLGFALNKKFVKNKST